MSNDIVVVGTGGTSRDIVEILETINLHRPCWNILGFVDDNPALAKTSVYGYPVLGPLTELNTPALARASVVLGVANDRNLYVRRDILQRLNLPDSRCPAIVSPSAVVSSRAVIGAGSVLTSGVFCAGNVRIGRFAIVLQNTVLGHDAQFSDFVSISANVSVAGAAVIEDGVYLGIGCAVLPNRRVGAGSVVGSGAVVMRDVPGASVVTGNPGRVIVSPSTST